MSNRDRWSDDPVLVVVTIASAVFIGALLWRLFDYYQTRAAIEAITNSTATTMQQIQREAIPRVKMPYTTTTQIPGRSVADCKAMTDGLINETFARCRSGYTEQQTVYR